MTRREKSALADAEKQRQRAERYAAAIRDHHRHIVKVGDWSADERLWKTLGLKAVA